MIVVQGSKKKKDQMALRKDKMLLLMIDRNTGKGIRENNLFTLQLNNTRLQKKLHYK